MKILMLVALLLAGCIGGAPPGSSIFDNAVLRDANGHVMDCTVASNRNHSAPAFSQGSLGATIAERKCIETYKRLGYQCVAGDCLAWPA
jgi:hypothetical protein